MKLFNLFKKSNEPSIRNELSKEDLNRNFKKLLSAVYSNLKNEGFKRKGTNTFYRIENEIVQKLYFQKKDDRFAVNVSLRPASWNRPELYYLLSVQRLGQLIHGYDKWFVLTESIDRLANEVIEQIEKYVYPIFEKTKSPKLVVENRNFLKKNKMLDEVLIVFSALTIEEENLAKEILEKKIKTLKNDDREEDWVLEDLKNYEELYRLLRLGRWNEIQEILKKNSVAFYSLNKIDAK